ncbi:carbohydrate ABC transporter permease [Anaerocolumna sp.]|uniref:carbohydrate ABC transporter permease n=1 Tax=Anaerocolumna sp. TaxID=2041569 RepID=UPI0028AE245F|nr:carbohydrate ABC transporter permease [Anaerocolumna sp.]
MDKKDKKAKLILKSERIISYIVLLLLTFLCLLPFYILLINATRSHPDIQKGFSFLPGKSFITNLKNVLSNENLPVINGIANSLFISGCNAILTTYFSSLTAYAIHAYEFKFKRALFLFILMIMMVPVQVSTLGFIDLMQKLKLLDSFIPLIAPSIAAPVVFFFMKQYMESNLAIEIIEAARIDGSGEFRTFNNIVLPIIKPAIAVQAIFAFVNTWNNYFVPSLIIKTNTKKTLPILIAQLRSADFLKFDMGQLYMLIAIAIFPVIIVYICLSKFIVRGVTAGSIKG